MISRIAKLFSAWMKKRLSPEKIEAAFAELPPATPVLKSDEVCICALQMEMKAYPSLEAWIHSLDDMLARAVRQGSRLVCLPEFYGMMPLLCSRMVQLLLKGVSLLPAASGGGGGGISTGPLLENYSFLNPAYEDMICRFARRYGVWLYGGTCFVWEAGRVFNRGFLVTPEGCVAARQDKIHLTQEEIAMGISPGDTMQVIPTAIGNIALSVCMDATYFETFRVAKAMGADYIIVPIGDMSEFDPYLALRGAQMRVNETGLTAIKPALVSAPDFPITFSGKAGIYYPMSAGLTSEEHPDSRGEGMVVSRFALSQLRNAKSDLFQRTNSGFDRNYCAELIKSARSRKNGNL